MTDQPTPPALPPEREDKKPIWTRWWMIVIYTIVGLVVLGSLVGGDEDGEPVAAQSTTTTQGESTETTTVAPSTTTTLPPTTTTTVPSTTTTTEPLSAEATLILWKSIFERTFMETMSGQTADALEDSFYWLDSVDRVSYDFDANKLIYEVTVDFESVYERDFQEWSDDTWDLYVQYGRDLFGAMVEGLEGNDDIPTPDWPTWMPGLSLIANSGRLSVECPGNVMDGIRVRQIVQSDYEALCNVTN
jgi:hypothetical protein